MAAKRSREAGLPRCARSYGSEARRDTRQVVENRIGLTRVDLPGERGHLRIGVVALPLLDGLELAHEIAVVLGIDARDVAVAVTPPVRAVTASAAARVDLRPTREVVARARTGGTAHLERADVVGNVCDTLRTPDSGLVREGVHRGIVPVARPDVRELLEDDLPVLPGQPRHGSVGQSLALGLVTSDAAGVDALAGRAIGRKAQGLLELPLRVDVGVEGRDSGPLLARQRSRGGSDARQGTGEVSAKVLGELPEGGAQRDAPGRIDTDRLAAFESSARGVAQQGLAGVAVTDVEDERHLAERVDHRRSRATDIEGLRQVEVDERQVDARDTRAALCHLGSTGVHDGVACHGVEAGLDGFQLLPVEDARAGFEDHQGLTQRELLISAERVVALHEERAVRHAIHFVEAVARDHGVGSGLDPGVRGPGACQRDHEHEQRDSAERRSARSAAPSPRGHTRVASNVLHGPPLPSR
jgi:hypothetical protein